MIAQNFSEKLTKARKDAGYTQQQVSDILNINRNTLASYETGRVEPNLSNLVKLADFYEVSVDWLVGAKGRNL